jgi:hypothetical protein
LTHIDVLRGSTYEHTLQNLNDINDKYIVMEKIEDTVQPTHNLASEGSGEVTSQSRIVEHLWCLLQA